MERKYGYKPDLMDFRDYMFSRKAAPLPVLQTVELSSTYTLPPIVDQGKYGSCTGQGIGAAVYFAMLNKHIQNVTTAFQPSRLFAYFNGRAIENTTKQDAGAQIRDVVKGVVNLGIPHEKYWLYVDGNVLRKPTARAYKDALKFKALKYYRVDNSQAINITTALANGYPVVCGASLYESFESDAVANTGVVPMPLPTEQLLGGHCFVIVGYNAQTKRFHCMNSWGTGWGDKGFFTMPEAYLTNTNLADDFWVIDTVE
jgi:C1A family cysteine protease